MCTHSNSCHVVCQLGDSYAQLLLAHGLHEELGGAFNEANEILGSIVVDMFVMSWPVSHAWRSMRLATMKHSGATLGGRSHSRGNCSVSLAYPRAGMCRNFPEPWEHRGS